MPLYVLSKYECLKIGEYTRLTVFPDVLMNRRLKVKTKLWAPMK